MLDKEFMELIRKENEKKKKTEEWTEAEKIREEIITTVSQDKDNCRRLLNLVNEFMQSDASKEEKNKLAGYCEMIVMTCPEACE